MSGSWNPGDFPRLTVPNYRITSPYKRRYNCIAWAAGSSTRWWWPKKFGYWPRGVPRMETLEAFLAAFATLGYEECVDDELEDGYEKVAFFALGSSGGNLVPTHAARQLPDGSWTSKLGNLEDIRHMNLADVEGPIYGTAVRFMRRRIQR